MTFKPGDYVKKIKGHRFHGWVVSVGKKQNGREVVTVEHDPDEWIFHFRPDELIEEDSPLYMTAHGDFIQTIARRT